MELWAEKTLNHHHSPLSSPPSSLLHSPPLKDLERSSTAPLSLSNEVYWNEVYLASCGL